MEKYIFCDLDGTFIDADLEKGFVSFLLANRLLKPVNYLISLVSIPFNKIRKLFGYGDLLKAWSCFRDEGETDKLFKKYVLTASDKIKVNENVFKLLTDYKDNGYTICLLTASNQELVKLFLKHAGMEYLFDSVVGSVIKSNGFIVEQAPYGKAKCKFSGQNNANKIGIANEYADRYYLLDCNEVYVRTADKKLLEMAKKKNWNTI